MTKSKYLPKQFTHTIRTILSFGLLGAITVAFSFNMAIADEDPVLANVEGYEIHLSEVEETRGLLPPALQQQDGPEVISLLIETLIDTRLAAKRARELGLDKTPEYKNTVARIEGQILKRMLFAQEIEKGITEEGIKNFFDKNVKNIPVGDEVHARHILVESEAKAKEVIKKLDDGADFNNSAMENSIGPSAPSGGDLG
ncbi:MAG: peptidylprolyl isomerase, partial [Rhodospirillaceae bacterium]|nr:peptidylprolyl isomerase [Rhodospirillaceae bacterium]